MVPWPYTLSLLSVPHSSMPTRQTDTTLPSSSSKLSIELSRTAQMTLLIILFGLPAYNLIMSRLPDRSAFIVPTLSTPIASHLSLQHLRQ
ncbi:hypothetical protein BDV33DRAFT_15724 [Aspergillus novoparasiticus]|uniref:Uncharacterized protein n=1 Tax=Aspergillus novoparasiticus TaxID=986946 RepID=A0A5N6EE57_9EURO|nr:hypothetical protein BDV33DRAFT_15724 [Aspergillus novoparasiticus]